VSETVPTAPPPAPARPSPVAKFLGEAPAAGGPFALLGLVPGSLTDDQIIGALDAQLARLSAHAECNTPQADEVRLALHAGAAQLLDPRVRAHLVARWGSAGDAAPAAPIEERRRFPRAPSAHVALEHDAVLTLGMFGGWNRRSLQRLSSLSAARGLGPDELADALRSLGARRPPPEEPTRPARPNPPISRLARPAAPVLAASEAPAASAPLPEQIDPAERMLKVVLLCAAGLLLLVVLAVAGLFVLVRSGGEAPEVAGAGPPPPLPQAAAPAPPPIEPKQAAAPEPSPVPEPELDVDLAVRELAASIDTFAKDPEAGLARFERAVASIAAGWPALAPDQMIAAQHQVIEFIYRAAPAGEPGIRAVEVVAAGAAPLAADRLRPGDVRPAVWSTGMLNRLAKENDLPTGLEQLIDARLNAALGPARPAGDYGFEAGSAAAVRAMPAIFVDQRGGSESESAQDRLESWRRWMAATGIIGPQAETRDRLLLGGLETLLVGGLDPSIDEAAFKVVRMVVGALTWRPGDQSREWMLKWFDDDRISSGDLYAVTSALATGSSAEHVNATMVVPVLASGSVRAEMREKYAQAWGLVDGPDRADVLEQLFEAAGHVLEQDDATRSLPEVLGSAVMLSRLNEAAMWAWRGNAEHAQSIMMSLEDDVALDPPNPQHNPGIQALDPQSKRSGSQWSAQYLAARKNIQVRIDLMSRLSSESMLDSVGAELLVYDALRGTPYEIRKRATERVMRFGDSPLIVNAVLEELPTVPATTANLTLIESIAICRLPGPGDPTWMLTARRALVERLLQLVASEGELALVDRQTELLARSYEGRIQEAAPASDAGGRTPPPPPPAELSASVLYRQWRARVDPALPAPSILPSPDEIERRRVGRAALARGMVQQFAAHQVSACELMACIVGSERSADALRLSAVLDDLLTARQNADHIFEQIRATEAAMLRLWLIRLGQEPPA
jgi:hypothetical protein